MAEKTPTDTTFEDLGIELDEEGNAFTDRSNALTAVADSFVHERQTRPIEKNELDRLILETGTGLAALELEVMLLTPEAADSLRPSAIPHEATLAAAEFDEPEPEPSLAEIAEYERFLRPCISTIESFGIGFSEIMEELIYFGMELSALDNKVFKPYAKVELQHAFLYQLLQTSLELLEGIKPETPLQILVMKLWGAYFVTEKDGSINLQLVHPTTSCILGNMLKHLGNRVIPKKSREIIQTYLT